MSVADTLQIQLEREALTLRISKLENSLLGEDFVNLTVEQSAAAEAMDVPDENARIEQLLQDLASAQGVSFIRNGAGHSATDAAAHLRMKWNGARNQIKSAEQFIELCGTRSGASGEAYRVRLKDGREEPSGDFLRSMLRARDVMRQPSVR